MLIYLLKIILLYMNCGIIAVVMGILVSVIGNFLSTAQRYIIGKNWSVIGWGLYWENGTTRLGSLEEVTWNKLEERITSR